MATILSERTTVLMLFLDSTLEMLKIGPVNGKKDKDVGSYLDVYCLLGGLGAGRICLSSHPISTYYGEIPILLGEFSGSSQPGDSATQHSNRDCCERGFIYTVSPKETFGLQKMSMFIKGRWPFDSVSRVNFWDECY